MILAVVILFAALGGGPALKALFNAILKVFGKGTSETIVNFNPGGEMAKIPKECVGCGLAVDPSKCVMHQSEHERSLRNETQIGKIWEEYGTLRKDTLAAASALRNETLATASKLKDDTVAAATKLKDEMVAGFDKVNTSIINSNTAILGALAGDRDGHGKVGRGGND